MMVTPYKVVKWSTEKLYFVTWEVQTNLCLKWKKIMGPKQLPTSQGNQPQEENHYVDTVESVANGITYCDK